jgi:diguanylate cyclase (GGDEF)-like protein/PAS domain S-box-containing protein
MDHPKTSLRGDGKRFEEGWMEMLDTERSASPAPAALGVGVLRGGRIVQASQGLAALFGFSPREMIGVHHCALCSLHGPAEGSEGSHGCVSPGVPKCGSAGREVRFRRNDGTEFQGRCALSEMQGDTLADLIIWSVEDTAVRREIDDRWRRKCEDLRLLIDSVPAMSIAYDENLRCVFANRRFAEFFGMTATSIVGKHLREVIGEEAYLEVKVHFDRVLAGHQTGYERIRRLPDGQCVHLGVELIPDIREDGRVRGLFAVTSDITEHKREQERIRYLAQHDSLTGLPNRMLFYDRLAQAMRSAKRNRDSVALLYVDLDAFKAVNDNLGHDAGDALLVSVARRLRDVVRDSDTIARLGGDEFTVILPGIRSRADVEAIARATVSAFSTPLHLDDLDRDIAVGVSVGMAIYPNDAEDADALVRAADTSMYKAKKSRGGRPAS